MSDKEQADIYLKASMTGKPKLDDWSVGELLDTFSGRKVKLCVITVERDGIEKLAAVYPYQGRLSDEDKGNILKIMQAFGSGGDDDGAPVTTGTGSPGPVVDAKMVEVNA